jgi:hypothetical protein
MSKDIDAAYYDAGGIEVIDIMKAKATPEQFEGYLLCNVIKYSLRMNHKGMKEKDARKLAHYSRWLNELYEEKDNEQ